MRLIIIYGVVTSALVGCGSGGGTSRTKERKYQYSGKDAWEDAWENDGEGSEENSALAFDHKSAEPVVGAEGGTATQKKIRSRNSGNKDN